MNQAKFKVKVEAVTDITPSVREYVVRSTDGQSLPLAAAGAHVAVFLDVPKRGQLVRHYSLLGGRGWADDPLDRYRFAVQRGWGAGSQHLHDAIQPGALLQVGPPIHGFSLGQADDHVLLLAGGIGVTPFISMARSLAQRRRTFELVYSAKSREHLAYADDLQGLCGAQFKPHLSAAQGRLNLLSLLDSKSRSTRVYACGSHAFVSSVQEAAQVLDWPAQELKVEGFDTPVKPGDQSFMVRLAQSQLAVQVGADETLLEALSRVHAPVYWDCRKGQCGLCATDVLAYDGELVHRDHYLDAKDHQSGQSLCLCVSRLKGKEMVLDL